MGRTVVLYLLSSYLSHLATCHTRQRLPLRAGQLTRAAVELAKLWRTDKYLRRLDVRGPRSAQPCLARGCAVCSQLACEHQESRPAARGMIP